MSLNPTTTDFNPNNAQHSLCNLKLNCDTLQLTEAFITAANVMAVTLF